MSNLRVGIIGFGYTGQLHLRAYQECGIAVTGIAETRPEALRNLPPGIRRYERYENLLEAGVDAVSICTPTAAHHRMTLDALAAGKHVLLEKPIATSEADADAMIHASKESGKTLFVGMTHRFYPEILESKQIVDEGGIGEIVMVRDSILEHFGFLNSPSWYLRPELAGGGTVLSSGVHLVDRVLWFLGEFPNAVSGYSQRRFLNQKIEDGAQMSLGFPSGRSAQLVFGLLAEPHPLVCDLELIGTSASLIVNTWKGYEVRKNGTSMYHAIYTSESHQQKVLRGLVGEVQEFCAAIREGRDPRPSVEESSRAFRVVTAFYRAASNGTIERPVLSERQRECAL